MKFQTATALVFLLPGALVLRGPVEHVRAKEIPSRAVAAFKGTPFQLRLSDSSDVILEPVANGLEVKNGVVTGVPQRAMVMRAVRNRPGIPAHDTTWIVVFAGPVDPPDVPPVPHRYRGGSLDLPTHLTVMSVPNAATSAEALAAKQNPVTDAGALLGRVLFFDPRLSANDGVSCASCHQQAAGFGDTARFSRGFDGRFTRRHSMALGNVRISAGRGFFWDQRAKTLEQQVLMPIQDSVEMGMSLPDLNRKLQLLEYYPPLFEAAFGTPEINTERTARALAQFLRSMVTSDSPFDRAFGTGNIAPDLSALDTLVREGFVQFRSLGCRSCHFDWSQTVSGAMNTGLDSISADSGAGRAMFRVPSLRNVAVRGRYMHDGRFLTLDEVIDFYSDRVQVNPNLDPRLRDRQSPAARRLNLSARQRIALKAFLTALTDSTFLTAPEFSDPFKTKNR
jgi:cytochrome c peroxidase